MADVISFSAHLSSSSLLTTLPSSSPSPSPSSSSSSSSTSLQPINRRRPFKKHSNYGAPDSWSIGKQFRPSFKINAVTAETEQPKWWERTSGPNMIDIHSTQEFLTSLSLAGEKLVIVDFYGTWCASCRALFPKLCRTAEEHPEVLFLKVNFDENKPMCKSLNVKVLPYFHFYRGADGQLESFSCSLAKFQKIKDAIQMHNTDRCSIGPPTGVGDLALQLPKE